MPEFKENIYFLPDQGTGFPLKLYSGGITHPDPNYKIVRQDGGNYYVLEYIVSGKGTLFVSGKGVFTPSAGDIYLLTPGPAHEYGSDREDPWEKIWFNVGGPLMNALVEVYGLRDTIYFRNCPMEGKFRALLEKIVENSGNTSESLAMGLHEIIGNLHQWKMAHPETKKSSDGLRLKEYLDEHVHSGASMKKLCEMIGKSPAQVLRIFRRDWGTTPCAYIQKQRLHFACQYLENTEYTIAEIASFVGFSDEFYFSNWFKGKSGSSPIHYKRNFRGSLSQKTQ